MAIFLAAWIQLTACENTKAEIRQLKVNLDYVEFIILTSEKYDFAKNVSIKKAQVITEIKYT